MTAVTTTPQVTTTPDDSNRAELEEAIGWLCQAAKREFPKVGNDTIPTPWDRRHAAINDKLTDWERAAV